MASSRQEQKNKATRAWRSRNKGYFTAYNRKHRVKHPETRIWKANRIKSNATAPELLRVAQFYGSL